MGDGWETARNPTRPSVLRSDAQGILQVEWKQDHIMHEQINTIQDTGWE